MPWRWVAAGALLLAGCAAPPDPADPPLWHVTGPKGEQGWLLGTIHALPRAADWKQPSVARALAASGTVYVEVAMLDDGKAMAAAFADLSHSPAHPPFSQRVPADLRDELAALLAKAGSTDSDYADTETWAAALTLARAGSASLSSEHGIDRAVLREARAMGKTVRELEGARGQLALFDALPENEQRDLLALVVAEDGAENGDSPSLAMAWLKGDMARIEQETRRGLLADPELRAVLFTGRNAAWTARIGAALAAGERPFVAVGAAHMAGAEGLPAMLSARGFTVVRVRP